MRKAFFINNNGEITGTIESNDPTLVIHTEQDILEATDDAAQEIERDLKGFVVKKDNGGRLRIEKKKPNSKKDE